MKLTLDQGENSEAKYHASPFSLKYYTSHLEHFENKPVSISSKNLSQMFGFVLFTFLQTISSV
jgi:hypothetical protein